MKRILLLTASILAFSPMVAEAKNINNKPFVHFYLDCEKNKSEALNKDLKDLPCVQKVGVHYCSIYDGLPKDVQESLSLELYCNFVAAEQNGDAERDARLMKAVEDAGCFKGNESRQTMLKKYDAGSDEADALQNFTSKLMQQEAACEIPIEHRRAKQAVDEEISSKPVTTASKKYDTRKKATPAAEPVAEAAPVVAPAPAKPSESPDKKLTPEDMVEVNKVPKKPEAKTTDVTVTETRKGRKVKVEETVEESVEPDPIISDAELDAAEEKK